MFGSTGNGTCKKSGGFLSECMDIDNVTKSLILIKVLIIQY